MARDLRRAFANATERQAVIDEALRLDGRGWTQQRIATALGVSQPTVHSWLDKHSPRRLSLQARIASEIRRELVCCDIYEQIQALRADLEAQQQLRESKKFRGHDTCFHGEWAAQIAEKVAK
jgi:predicted transcriptional regulator